MGTVNKNSSHSPIGMINHKERGDLKCGSGNCDTVKNTRAENAGVEKSGADRRDGKCKSSRLAVWKIEPRLYSETALSYFIKLSSDFWVNRVIFIALSTKVGP